MRKPRLWYRVSPEEQEILVELGGFFYKQTRLANLLGTTGGAIARYRADNGIYMPREKVHRKGEEFAVFTELLEKLRAQQRVESPEKKTRAPSQPRTDVRASLKLLINPSPPPTAEEKDEQKENLAVALVRGRWTPKGAERPFNQQHWRRQQRIREHTERIMERRQKIKTLRF